MEVGFQLNPAGIAEDIHRAVVNPGWSISTYFDGYARPDFRTGMPVEVDPVDRAVVVFVGSREEAAKVVGAARKALS